MYGNSLGIRNFRQQDKRQTLQGGPTTLTSMSEERIYSTFSEKGDSVEEITASIYQADTLALLEAIRDPEEAEILYQKSEKGIPIKNEDT